MFCSNEITRVNVNDLAMASLHINRTINDSTAQFFSIIEKILSLTSTKLSEKKQLNACLNDLNELDYRCLNIVNSDVRYILI